MGVTKRQADNDRYSKGRFSKIYSPSEIEKYNRGWAEFMVDIFHEQIERLKVSDTNQLMQSIHEMITTGDITTIEHRFLRYGLFVAAGVGREYNVGNDGNLLFLGDKYRDSHGLNNSRQVGYSWSQGRMLSPKYERKKLTQGKHKGEEVAMTSGERRLPKDWFFRKYFYSMIRLNEKNAIHYGEAYTGMMATLIDMTFSDDPETRIRSNRF